MSFRGQTQTNLLGPELLRNRTFYRDFRSIPLLNPVPSSSAQISFSRSTTATRVNENGLIETVGIDVPRFDYDPVTRSCRGLLIEEGRTNLQPRSNEFLDGTWTGAALVSANAGISPDGSNNAWLYTQPNNFNEYIYSGAFSGTANTTYTVSIFIKKGTRTEFGLQIDDNGFGGDRYIVITDYNTILSTGGSGFSRILSTAIIPQGNSWFRLSITFTTRSSSVGNIIVMIGRAGTAGVDSSGTTFIYGVQVEQGTFATSYIPTAATSIARSGDICSVSGAEFSKINYSPDRGTLFASVIKTSAHRCPSLFLSNNEGIELANQSDARVIMRKTAGGSSDYGFGPLINVGSRMRNAVTYVSGRSTACINGGTVGIVNPTGLPLPATTLGLSMNIFNTQQSVIYESVGYFNIAVSDNILRSLTTL